MITSRLNLKIPPSGHGAYFEEFGFLFGDSVRPFLLSSVAVVEELKRRRFVALKPVVEILELLDGGDLQRIRLVSSGRKGIGQYIIIKVVIQDIIVIIIIIILLLIMFSLVKVVYQVKEPLGISSLFQ